MVGHIEAVMVAFGCIAVAATILVVVRHVEVAWDVLRVMVVVVVVVVDMSSSLVCVVYLSKISY